MDITKGCQCASNCSIHPAYRDASEVPVAFLVERNGKELAVCTRCILRGDVVVARLFDYDTPAEVFYDYDVLGLMGVVIPALEDFEAFKKRWGK